MYFIARSTFACMTCMIKVTIRYSVFCMISENNAKSMRGWRIVEENVVIFSQQNASWWAGTDASGLAPVLVHHIVHLWQQTAPVLFNKQTLIHNLMHNHTSPNHALPIPTWFAYSSPQARNDIIINSPHLNNRPRWSLINSMAYQRASYYWPSNPANIALTATCPHTHRGQTARNVWANTSGKAQLGVPVHIIKVRWMEA